MITLTLSTSCHGQPCVQSNEVTNEEALALRSIVCNSYIDHDDYHAKQYVQPFVQGFDVGSTGVWILIEFWSGTPADHAAYVAYLNRRLPEMVALRRQIWGDEAGEEH